MAIQITEKGLFTISKENMKFLNDVSKNFGMTKSKIIDDIVTEMRTETENILNPLFSNKNENFNSFLLMAKGFEILNKKSDDLIKLQKELANKGVKNGEAK